VIGDGYTGWDNGVQIFANPVPFMDWKADGFLDAFSHWTNNPDAAYADPLFAHATVALAPGAHSFTFQETSIPTGFNDGTIAFEVVPAPPGLLLLGSGLIGLGLARLRKRW